MDPNNVWQRAKHRPIQASPEIAGNDDQEILTAYHGTSE